MQLFIPKKIKVGFQARNDTYTQKLAYVIYFDEKGVLRKQKSWESWRSKDIEPTEFSNVPTEGFVLNKKVGGYNYSWNHRNTYVRIYDPRGFEFEITVENLLFILSENDCMKGKGLTGEYVYGWAGTELILLPTNCEDYISSTKFTEVQSKKIPLKDLKVGYQYRTKDLSVVTYIGKHKYYTHQSYYRPSKKNGENSHIFYSNKFYKVTSGDKLAEEIGESPDYAELIDKYYNSIYASDIDSFVVNGEDKEYCESLYSHTYGYSTSYYVMSIKNNKIEMKWMYLHKDNNTDRIKSLQYSNKLRLKNGKMFTILQGNIKEYCDE